MSDLIFISLPTANLPLAVVAPLVEIVATILSSALTASKSKTPPEESGTRSRWKGWPKCFGIQFRLTQSSTSSWTRVSAIWSPRDHYS